MAATNTPALVSVTTEGAIQVAYFTIASVANTNTTDFSNWSKNIIDVQATPSTSAGIGATVSGGTVTWAVSTGTPNLIVRLAFQ